jgi:hypothetical protein
LGTFAITVTVTIPIAVTITVMMPVRIGNVVDSVINREVGGRDTSLDAHL